MISVCKGVLQKGKQYDSLNGLLLSACLLQSAWVSGRRPHAAIASGDISNYMYRFWTRATGKSEHVSSASLRKFISTGLREADCGNYDDEADFMNHSRTIDDRSYVFPNKIEASVRVAKTIHEHVLKQVRTEYLVIIVVVYLCIKVQSPVGKQEQEVVFIGGMQVCCI